MEAGPHLRTHGYHMCTKATFTQNSQRGGTNSNFIQVREFLKEVRHLITIYGSAQLTGPCGVHSIRCQALSVSEDRTRHFPFWPKSEEKADARQKLRIIDCFCNFMQTKIKALE